MRDNVFYELQQKNSGLWKPVGFFKDKKTAWKYAKLFNTKVEVYEIQLIKREFLTLEDIQEDSE